MCSLCFFSVCLNRFIEVLGRFDKIFSAIDNLVISGTVNTSKNISLKFNVSEAAKAEFSIVVPVYTL